MTHPDTTIRDEFAHLEDDWQSAERYLSIYIDESQQTLDELTEALLSLEAGGGRKDIEKLFVAAHRLKGSSASIGLNRAAKLAHLMEDILQVLVDKQSTLEPQIADGMLACTDGLRHYVNAMCSGRPEDDQFAQLAQQLAEAQAACDMALGREPAASAETAPETPCAEEPSACLPQTTPLGIDAALQQHVAAAVGDQDREHTLVGQVVFDPEFPLIGLKAQLLYSKLSNLGNVRFLEPPPADIESIEKHGVLSFGVVTERPLESVHNVLQIAGVQQVFLEPLAAPQAVAQSAVPQETAARPMAKPAADAGKQTAAKPPETLRVNIEQLDHLMNLAGQLAIGKARVAQIGDSLKQTVLDSRAKHMLQELLSTLKKIAAGADGDAAHSELESLHGMLRQLQMQLEVVQEEMRAFASARTSVNELFETIHLLDGVGDGIRRSVMDMRMLPIGPLFHRFDRVIRDMTHANGKEISLVVSGEKTELDKRMIDELGDPLIHLIRNAADHGVELPATREAAGKPRGATISLDAYHRGSNIVIRVSDDGRGLNADRIRAKAIAKGLIAAADAEQLTPQQIFQFIWMPGLSTAEKVTDVSGRGVGMDIVRSKINEINGTIDVESAAGRGTTFTIKLPLTLAILPSLMVEIAGEVFAVPLESVLEIVRVRRSDMRTVQGHWTAPIRERVVAVATLESIFSWNRQAAESAGEGDDATLVLLGEGNRQLGLVVQRVLGEDDVVIKSIAENYRNVAGVAGATILGDGRISLILDPTALIEISSHPIATPANSKESP